jgi:TrmH family RNA methyltransferase
MLTKNTITYIKSLHEKKWRNETQSFLVEWEKNLIEFLDSDFEFLDGYFSSSFIEKYGSKFDTRRVAECSVSDIEKITSLSKNTVGVGIFAMKKLGRVDARGIVLVLDGINDPGNLGTIIRTADWYGVKTIIASHNTVDIYNPKVIMATMGSFSRVQVHYRDLSEYLEWLQWPIYGAYLDGENIHTKKIWREDVYLVIWSESHGISQAIESYITDKITIPRFWSAESLNAWVATAIILDNICRK